MAGRKKGAPHRQAIRLIRMTHMLALKFYTLEEIAMAFSVTGRQVQRDLRAFQDAWWTIEEQREPGQTTRYRLVPPNVIAHEEARAMMAALQNLAPPEAAPPRVQRVIKRRSVQSRTPLDARTEALLLQIEAEERSRA